MNYPKPKPLNAIIKTPAERAPVYLCVPQYGKKQIFIQSPKPPARSDFGLFRDDEESAGGPGLSRGAKVAIAVVGAAAIGIVAYMLYKKLKNRR